MQLSPKQSLQPRNPSSNIVKVGQIKITYYTDPLCCWSWALETHWRKLLDTYPDQIAYEYVMGGMIPHWKNYNDPMNSVSKPIQMGPVWMHASEVTQVKMKYSIWHEDPPSSSYPPCIAVKTVGLQSKVIGEQYLYNIRKALMEDGLNISKTENLFSLAKELASDEFDFSLFTSDWETGKGTEAFRSDLQKTKFHSIGRYPTLTMQNSLGTGIFIVGYRPFEVLEQVFNSINSATNATSIKS